MLFTKDYFSEFISRIEQTPAAELNKVLNNDELTKLRLLQDAAIVQVGREFLKEALESNTKALEELINIV